MASPPVYEEGDPRARGASGSPDSSLPPLGQAFLHPGDYVRRLRRNLKRSLRRRPGSTTLVLLPAVLMAVAWCYVAMLFVLSPSVQGLQERELAHTTVLYTAGGEELSRLYEENRTWVPLDSIAPIVPKALVAIEDQRFYKHWGIDFLRTAGAMVQTVKGNVQGGSTITMQLARNAYADISDDWILTRKIKEWITALRLHDQYTKDEILEIYLNTVPFSYNAFGVEAAAKTYFNKPASRMDTLQAAALMAMLRGPTLYNPVRNPEKNRQRRNLVLQELADIGAISEARARALKEQDTPMDFQPPGPQHNLAPHFAEHVRKKLEAWARENGYDIYRDGLRVYTTIDAQMQKAAAKAVKNKLDDLQAVVDVSWSSTSTPYFSASEEAYRRQQNPATSFDYFWQTHERLLNATIRKTARYKRLTAQGTGEEEALQQLKAEAAFLDSVKTAQQRLETGLAAMDPRTGQVKVWVGGRNFEKDQYDHVALAKRQPGSTFKPFVYATALERGYRPSDSLRDAKIEYVNEQTGQRWSPGNFGGESGRLMTVKQGLAQSKNTITAQLTIDVGPGRVAETAHRMGIQSDLQAVPSLGLGTSEVSLLEMVGAYGTIANVGRYQEPMTITRIESRSGRLLENFQSESRQALPEDIAYTLLTMMEAVVGEGTGRRIRQYYGGGDLAAKTGTTQENADGWFMLVHPHLVAGAWVGFNSPQVTFRTRYWGQGAHNALKVVGTFLQNIDLSPATFEAPYGYVPPDTSDRDPDALFARQDVRFDSLGPNDSLAASDPFDFNFDEERPPDSLETGLQTSASTDTASAEPPPPDPTEDIEGQQAADSLNQQQGIERGEDG